MDSIQTTFKQKRISFKEILWVLKGIPRAIFERLVAFVLLCLVFVATIIATIVETVIFLFKLFKKIFIGQSNARGRPYEVTNSLSELVVQMAFCVLDPSIADFPD